MSSGKPARPSNLDRWGCKPAGRGVVRGVVRNVRQHEEEGPFGPLTVMQFDLFQGEGTPLVPVEMRGNDFIRRILAETLADVLVSDPAARPLRPTHLKYPHHPGEDVVSFSPGRDDTRRKDRLLSALAIGVPVLICIAGAILLALYFR